VLRDSQAVAAIGRLAEAWRYLTEDFVAARRAALHEEKTLDEYTIWLGVEQNIVADNCRDDLHPCTSARRQTHVLDPALLDPRFRQVPREPLEQNMIGVSWLGVVGVRKWIFCGARVVELCLVFDTL
jgi:hypothetical protein